MCNTGNIQSALQYIDSTEEDTVIINPNWRMGKLRHGAITWFVARPRSWIQVVSYWTPHCAAPPSDWMVSGYAPNKLASLWGGKARRPHFIKLGNEEASRSLKPLFRIVFVPDSKNDSLILPEKVSKGSPHKFFISHFLAGEPQDGPINGTARPRRPPFKQQESSFNPPLTHEAANLGGGASPSGPWTPRS